MVAALEDPLPHERIHCYKLQTKLKRLDPLDKIAIKDWLIELKAAAGFTFHYVWAPQITRADYPARMAAVGEDWRGLSEEKYDTLYDKHLDNAINLEAAVFGFIINHCDWRNEPELAGHVRGSGDGSKGWAATQDGRSLYEWLDKHGSTDDMQVQDRLAADWAGLYAESMATSAGRSRTTVVFSKTTTAEDVIDRLSSLLQTYEKNEIGRAHV